MQDPGDSLEQALRVVALEVADEDIDARLSWRTFATTELGESLPPITVGRFEVLRRIGHGGFGRVYEGWDPRLRRRVALKLHASAELPGRARARFLREAQTLARMSRPDIVEVFGFGTCDDGVYFAMALLDGTTLRAWQSQPRPWRACVELYIGVAEALAAMHDAGLVHRDVKPDNVIVRADGRVCLIDFGLAAADPSRAATQPGSGGGPTGTASGGTVGYAAPEQLAHGVGDARSDQFALCVSLFEGLTGRWPFAPDQIAQMARGGAVRLRAAGIPRPLGRVLARGLMPDPTRRFPSLHALADALRAVSSRRPRALIWGPAVALAGLLPAVLLPASRPCGSSELGDESLAELEQGLVDRGVPASEAARRRAALERRRGLIGELQQRACDGRDGGTTQADAVLACLRRADRAAVELTQVLATHGVEGSGGAELLASLPDPQACVAANEASDDEAVQALLAALDRVRVQLAVGAVLDAQAGAAEAVSTAQALARPDLRLSAMGLQARALDQLGRDVEAGEVLRTAVALAQVQADDHAQAELWTRLARLESVDLDDAAAAEHALAQAEVVVRRLGDPAPLSIDLRLAEASLREIAGDVEGVTRALDQARALLTAQGGEDDLRSIGVTTKLAGLAAQRRDWERADALYREARARLLVREGPGSANVLAVSFDLALDAFEQGRFDDAAIAFAELLATQRESFGDDSVVLAPTLVMLAQIHLQQGDLIGAQAAGERAWRLQRDGLPPGHAERGSALAVLSRVHATSGDTAAFLDVNLRLLADLDAIGDTRDARPLSRNIGWALCELRRCAGAAPYFERLRRLATEDTDRVAALHGLARVAWARGDANAAREGFEAALAIAEADLAAAEPRELADLRLHYAQLLTEIAPGSSRIRTLARDAATLYQQIGTASADAERALALANSQ